jgi:hypothetical protein
MKRNIRNALVKTKVSLEQAEKPEEVEKVEEVLEEVKEANKEEVDVEGLEL